MDMDMEMEPCTSERGEDKSGHVKEQLRQPTYGIWE